MMGKSAEETLSEGYYTVARLKSIIAAAIREDRAEPVSKAEVEALYESLCTYPVSGHNEQCEQCKRNARHALEAARQARAAADEKGGAR